MIRLIKEQIKNEQLLEVLNNIMKTIENGDEIKSQDSLKMITEIYKYNEEIKNQV